MVLPKITILLATFNRAHLILETLESIVNQTYTHFECLITDDNSTDDTEKVVKAFIEKDERFGYYRKPSTYPQGLSATRNFGLNLSKERDAQFIQFFDDDDIMHPQKLELQVLPLLEDSKLDFTLCMYRKFDTLNMIDFDLKNADDGSCKITFKDLAKAFFLNLANMNSPGPLWRASTISKYRFDEQLYYAEEREFYLRILLTENPNYKPVEFILFWYRKHPHAITSGLYSDPQIKPQSERLMRKRILNFMLQRKNVPFYLIKSYLVSAKKEKSQHDLKCLRDYLLRTSFFKPRQVALLIYSYL